MQEELKMCIKDYRETERHLKSIGAFTEEINAVDTYFRQPKCEVFIITSFLQ